MARRPTTRLLIDLGFAAAVVACGFTAYALSGPPAVRGVCEAAPDTGPRRDALLADGRITVAIVLGELSGGPADHNAWSARMLRDELHARGYDRRADLAIDIEVVREDDAAIGAALERALATHEVVYYNGHSYDGDLAFAVPHDGYQIVMLDTCWSTQLYSARLVAPDRDVLSNADRTVTGSIESLLILLDGIVAGPATYQPILSDMRSRAIARASARAPISRFKEPERYRLDAACHGQSAGQ